MATVVKIKRTAVSGRAANTTTLPTPGELGLNMTDGILYGSNGSSVFEIGANNTTVKVTNSLSVGTNLVISTSSLSVGNSSVNTQVSSTQVNTDIIQADVAVYVGANVDLLETGLFIGNSTVNSTANSTTMKVDVGFMTNQSLNYSFTVPSTQNMMIVGPYSIGVSGNLVVSTGARVVIV